MIDLSSKSQLNSQYLFHQKIYIFWLVTVLWFYFVCYEYYKPVSHFNIIRYKNCDFVPETKPKMSANKHSIPCIITHIKSEVYIKKCTPHTQRINIAYCTLYHNSLKKLSVAPKYHNKISSVFLLLSSRPQVFCNTGKLLFFHFL